LGIPKILSKTIGYGMTLMGDLGKIGCYGILVKYGRDYFLK